ncbi:5'-nucleotidase C-terminal domain-containing protein [Vagococcus carniphilus]|uniref:bifunctional metallophosphatase/5'-nucleotidase n=1 Tax=Vagococcus carniphilus TaxID=218144 RepID=UPI0028900F04|nr:5'-nucleotidase C-terminal domain-containing protein [Vagococcus carniphilus]MDT2850304.1 5'-nucleotidase C-terminal domain-containing protein [Vagococcus carniphilus]
MKKTKKGSSLLLTAILLCPLTLTATSALAAEDTTASSKEEVSINQPAEAPAEDKATTETSPKEDKASKTIPIQMLGVNDFHGALDTKASVYLEDPLGGKDIRYGDVGRASVLAAHLDKAQAEFADKTNATGKTERIQAGDLVGASPANSALLRDEPTMRVFNEMKFTIGTLGNHEFDKGLGEFVRMLKGQAPDRADMGGMSDDLWSIFKDYERGPSTQKIAIANLVNKTTGNHGDAGKIPYDLPPYIVESYGEGEDRVQVGYIGVVTKEFPSLVLAEHTKDFEVIDEGEAVAKYTKELREDKNVDAIVVVSHVAATSKQGDVQGEVVDMMNTVDQKDPENSVDVVFAGHNHKETNGLIKREGKKDVRVVQSTSQGKAFIDLTGELDSETNDFKETPSAKIVPTEASKVTPDANVQAIVDEASEAIKPITNAAVAKADPEKLTVTEDGKKMISRSANADDESAAGNLITDGQLYMANNTNLTDASGKEVKADFALTNSGGIRADLIVNDKDEITWGAAQTVQPFGNILQVVSMTGKDVKEALNQQYNNGKTGYTLQISGLTYAYTGMTQPAKGEAHDGSFKVVDVRKADGTPVKDDETYNVIINDFLFGGGDGFTAFTKGTLVTAMDTDTDTFVDYFKAMDKKGEKIGSPELGRKQKQTVTEKELSDASKVDEVKKKATVIKGETLPGAEVRFTTEDGKELGKGTADKDGKFEVKVTAVTDKQINFHVAVGPTRIVGPVSVVFPEGPYIKDGRHVQVVKKNYSLWSNFDWKERNKSNNVLNEIFTARGKYEHENGATYLSLYDNQGKWQGYINENATKEAKDLQGDYIKYGKYVTINRTGYNTWSNFDWKERNESGNLLGETYLAKGKYKHANGSTYLSLYDNKGKWHGYINKSAVKVGKGQQGAYINDGRYVTVSKDNYKIWSNFNWKKRTTSKKVFNETFQAKGRYKHFNGATYFSLYNDKGEWQGYINANAVKIGEGRQGAYISYGKKVKINKKGYNTWSSFSWKKRNTTDELMGKTFTAKGKYNHMNGATYYSLYDNDGKWHGYVNKNAVK